MTIRLLFRQLRKKNKTKKKQYTKIHNNIWKTTIKEIVMIYLDIWTALLWGKYQTKALKIVPAQEGRLHQVVPSQWTMYLNRLPPTLIYGFCKSRRPLLTVPISTLTDTKRSRP